MKTDTPKPIYLKDYAPPAFLISETCLDVTLDPAETRVKSRLSVLPNPAVKKRSSEIRLDGELLRLLRVAIDGEAVDGSRLVATAKDLTIRDVPAKPFTLEIETICDPAANKALTGLYVSRGVYCTQCEAEGFRRITYYLDRPDVLARFRVRIEAPKQDAPVLLSNGNLVGSGDLPGKRHFAVWEDPFPKPAYLFALVAGKLAMVEDHFTTGSGRDVTLRIYVEPGKEDRCGWAMESLKRSMKWDEDRFGLEYDLDMFMIVAVSDFNMGAMENKGLNVFNDALILARPDTATDGDYERIESVIAHEYFHNWTGDRVTCRDWFQLCLKEGLTVFRDQEFTADMRSAVVKRIQDVRMLRSGQFPEDAGPLAHPVRPSSFIEINNFYTRTVYNKGAELCRMLQTVLGRDGFRKGLALYFERHDGQAVTVEDFVSALGDANGTDLSPYLLWYNQAGTPTLDARLSYSEGAKEARLTLSQTFPDLPGQPKRKAVPIPVKLGLLGPNGGEIPLEVEGKPVDGGLVVLSKKKEVFTFEKVGSRPVLSLLRDFSAPVNLNAGTRDKDMLTLIRADTDLFNRWQSAQAFALKHIVGLANAIAKGETARVDPRFVAAVGEVADDDTLEHAYRAAFLTLPSESDVALAIAENVDPEAIHRARTLLREAMGKSLRAILEGVYERSAPVEPYNPDAESAGRRALRQSALSLLAAGKSRFGIARVKEQAKTATNMTEAIGALSILSQVGGEAYDQALQRFHRKWKDEPLVINKWFALQASSPSADTLARMADLVANPLFSIQNPNRVRAVYGAFAHGNQVRFNDASGAGYDLIADAVIEIDGFNPQMASRLVSAFESWRIFEPNRRAFAERALGRILDKKDLSPDVFEIGSKIVGDRAGEVAA
ncbi:aminopeptidase N [Rhodomicrobium sp. Az07]|uniref:aminopeptidase N n=1 Tax=Rhodomicrobium sp. Az07 TaxID=2839034 RepID=UPI001BE5C56D|nr:aminopeptidase N [Rhodomicrobium sp. Az07]MBT3070037.1 aminopeptidase N [Rhodomicrobium sp. Az07]